MITDTSYHLYSERDNCQAERLTYTRINTFHAELLAQSSFAHEHHMLLAELATATQDTI